MADIKTMTEELDEISAKVELDMFNDYEKAIEILQKIVLKLDEVVNKINNG